MSDDERVKALVKLSGVLDAQALNLYTHRAHAPQHAIRAAIDDMRSVAAALLRLSVLRPEDQARELWPAIGGYCDGLATLYKYGQDKEAIQLIALALKNARRPGTGTKG